MYDEHLQQMATLVANELSLDPEGRAGALQALREYFDGRIGVTWERGDVVRIAAEQGITLTPEQVDAVLGSVFDHYDATVGISYDVVARWVLSVHSYQEENDGGSEFTQ